MEGFADLSSRHNIWTPVLDEIQDHLFLEKLRVSRKAFYMRNAILISEQKSSLKTLKWESFQEAVFFKELHREYRPMLIISFEAFAFEFCRRALGEKPDRAIKFLNLEQIKNEFYKRVCKDSYFLVPLPHPVIAKISFLNCHEVFTLNKECNYFEHVGAKLAKKIFGQFGDDKDIFLRANS